MSKRRKQYEEIDTESYLTEQEVLGIVLAVPCPEVWKALSPDGTYHGGRRARAWYRDASKKTVDLVLNQNRWKDYGSETRLDGNSIDLVMLLAGWDREHAIAWLFDFAERLNIRAA